MKSFDIISLDLFNTLVYIDRSSFDLYNHMERAFLQFPEFVKEVSSVPLTDIIEGYYTAQRKMFSEENEKEFRNDDLLIEILEDYVDITPNLITLANKIITFYFDSALPLIHPFPGLFETLKFLKEEEYILVLTSNHSWAKNGWDVLRKYDLIRYFNQIIFSGDIGWRKPSSKVFSSALAGLSYRSKNHVIHVGDSIEEDIMGALKFGIKALWIRSPRKKTKQNNIIKLDTHGIISDIRELLDVL